MVLLVAMMVMLAFTSAQAGFYIGVQGGPNFPMGSGAHVTVFNQSFNTNNGTINNGFLIGAQVGYDFLGNPQIPTGAKYYTLALDYQFNNYDVSRHHVSVRVAGLAQQVGWGDISGSQNALSFLAILKLPLLEDKEFPTGRLFPYIGVGPCVLWTTFVDQTSTNIGLVVEPGIRFMIIPHLSADLAYRFRYAQPSFSGVNGNLNVSFNSTNSAVVFRLNYHF